MMECWSDGRMEKNKRQDAVAKMQKKPLITKTRKNESMKEEGVIWKPRSFFVFSKFRAFVAGLSFFLARIF
jgi:hypothetical protein